jgi:hypothetical protein
MTTRSTPCRSESYLVDECDAIEVTIHGKPHRLDPGVPVDITPAP